jgi:hypothetical protein
VAGKRYQSTLLQPAILPPYWYGLGSLGKKRARRAKTQAAQVFRRDIPKVKTDILSRDAKERPTLPNLANSPGMFY